MTKNGNPSAPTVAMVKKKLNYSFDLDKFKDLPPSQQLKQLSCEGLKFSVKRMVDLISRDDLEPRDEVVAHKVLLEILQSCATLSDYQLDKERSDLYQLRALFLEFIDLIATTTSLDGLFNRFDKSQKIWNTSQFLIQRDKHSKKSTAALPCAIVFEWWKYWLKENGVDKKASWLPQNLAEFTELLEREVGLKTQLVEFKEKEYKERSWIGLIRKDFKPERWGGWT